MKKILVAILIMSCLVFAGCSNVGTVGLIQNSDGSVVEFYRIPYAETELLINGITSAENEKIKSEAKQKLDEHFDLFIQSYQLRIDENQSYSAEQKEELKNGVSVVSSFENEQDKNTMLEYIQYEIHFANSTCYLEFKNANQLINEPKQVVVEKTLFTTTTKVVKHPVFDNIAQNSITLGNYAVSLIENVVVDVLAGENPTQEQVYMAQTRWASIKLNLNYNGSGSVFSYCYVVPSARFHSNADKVLTQNGYYYHFWEVDSENISNPEQQKVQIEYWTTTANKPVWYAVAVLGGVVTIAVTFVIYKKNKNKQEKEFKDLI